MTARTQYCGDISDEHRAGKCLACKRIWQRMQRGATLQEAQGPLEPTCRSCRIRFRVPPPAHDSYTPILLTAKEVHWLDNAARLFDHLAGDELFTAEEFLNWLKPDLNGKWANHAPFHDGITRKGYGPSSADPLPMVPPRLRKLVS
jgi:hypothetical protein